MVKNGQSTPRSVPAVPFDGGQRAAFGVEVLILEELRRRSLDHSIFRAHRTGFHLLLVITGGAGWHMVDFDQHPVEAGALVHVAPGQVQRFDGEHDLAGFVALFQPEVCGAEAPPRRWPARIVPTPEDFDALRKLVDLMLDLQVRELSAAPDRVVWRLLPALLELCEGAVRRQLDRQGLPVSEPFEAFESLLEEQLTHHRDLAWYARTLGYSEKTLSRWCRRIVGIGAKAHIDRRVALEGQRLLVHTDLAVETIALRLGFSEATNFVKFFKRLIGTTPSAFRALYRG
ncbi:MAG: AraC family transcriptional regulator [Acidobacteriota bacterium]